GEPPRAAAPDPPGHRGPLVPPGRAMTALAAGRRFVSLRAKFLWSAVLVIALVMAVLIGVVERRQRASILDEVQRRGLVLAHSLAAVSSRPLLLYNFTALEQNVARVGTDADVAYALILDAEGKVAASSVSPAQIGTVLDDPVARRAAAATAPLLQETTLP